jgi:hypothetical protein
MSRSQDALKRTVGAGRVRLHATPHAKGFSSWDEIKELNAAAFARIISGKEKS